MGNLGYCRLYCLNPFLSLAIRLSALLLFFKKYPLFYFSYSLFPKYLTFLGDLFRFFCFYFSLGRFWIGTGWALG